MKKLISLMLALILVVSMATVAFAEESSGSAETPRYAASDATSFTIKKTYDSTETFVPGEVLAFNIESVNGNPGAEMISIGTENKYTVNGLSNDITVTVPSYSAAGIYKYTIEEIGGNTAGVTTYDTNKTINVAVLVEYDNVNNKLVIGNDTTNGITYFIENNGSDGEVVKVDTFENVFKTNDFTVAKNVDGNMANESDKFEIKVKLTVPAGQVILTDIKVGEEIITPDMWENNSYTATLNLSEDDGATGFEDIPYGITVSVEETDSTVNMQGYTLTGIDNNNITIGDGDAKQIVVNNEKSTEVDTGISLDSMPFVLMLVVCAGAAVLFVIKRRSVEF